MLNTTSQHTHTEELLDIINEAGKVIGQAGFKEAHQKGLLHRNCRVLILTSQNEVVVHLRGHKTNYPHTLDGSAGGHLSAGDSYIDASLREVREELGIALHQKDLTLIGTIENRANPSYENMIGQVFIARHDGPFTVQDVGEVAQIQTVPFADLQWLVKKFPQFVCPQLQGVIKAYAEHLEKK